MSDLTAVMGMSTPSIYAAFGDEESLFRKVVERYMAGPGSYLGTACGQPTAEALAVNPRSATVRDYLTGLREAGVTTLAERLRAFSGSDGLPPGAEATALARLLVTVADRMMTCWPRRAG
ncbi:hypothetical protein [Kitasatospora brasiliensis]|uniref:hypothetical protein n=1 Tax=Kitasatospora brasiliensis TaxID=3058040 RepID=UPI00292E8E0D|nr:hypothetical protein [Kitasatospora sp. K002]